MLREEILQYLEEFQSIRNMMYIVTSTILIICLKGENTKLYAYLIPLIVILPSYLVYFDYWKNVIRDTTYLMVFYESIPDFPIKWETRLRIVSKKKDFKVERNYHKTPYIVCTIMCISLYFLHIDNIKNYKDILMGFVIIIVSIIIFLFHKDINDKKFIEDWKKVKENENQ